MNRRSGGYRLPIPTDELFRLIEERAGEVDTYADLPEGIHGQTSLFYDRRPEVKIAESIYQTRSDHLVRTTVCHELGHYADFRIMPSFSFQRVRITGREREMSA
jgi:hypothetical protein